MINAPLICVICKKPIPAKGNWIGGNNAEPIARGRCCDACDWAHVIPARIRQEEARSKKIKEIP